ncbi:oxysterol-binding protein 1 [Clonorchis sinensis]|uniref:Oxysterol-binding protein 1 n=1 Tax=Clonorchis sinensis TaxID=79923 RepID=G7YUT8_CLOSI|nr:oxysterol-binding protein 1 [Clonorchis sinensis]
MVAGWGSRTSSRDIYSNGPISSKDIKSDGSSCKMISYHITGNIDRLKTIRLIRCPEAVGRRCRGTFNLKDATLVIPSSQTSFVLVEATGRKHHLKALSEQDKERWIKVLADLTNGQNNTGMHYAGMLLLGCRVAR